MKLTLFGVVNGKKHILIYLKGNLVSFGGILNDHDLETGFKLPQFLSFTVGVY